MPEIPDQPMGKISDEVYVAAARSKVLVARAIAARSDPQWAEMVAVHQAKQPEFRAAVESAYRAGREDAAREALDPLLRLRDEAEADKRGRERDGDSEGVMCCVQYLDGLNIAINLLSRQLGEDQDTPEGRT